MKLGWIGGNGIRMEDGIDFLEWGRVSEEWRYWEKNKERRFELFRMNNFEFLLVFIIMMGLFILTDNIPFL